MGKNKKRTNLLDESQLILTVSPGETEITTPTVDTHTHLLSTFRAYHEKYPEGANATVYDFARAVTAGRNVEAMIDVYCEAPIQKAWKELADSALTEESRKEKWGGMEYWFVMGVHPHESKSYTDEVEAEILEAMKHPRCVGWGEIGLDYHYNLSPPEIQREVFTRQLRHAVQLGKPLTIHTREAEEDTERIMKAEVPRSHKIHVHCFTDSPGFAQCLLEHFPNLYIGITGVITYSTNLNTSAVIRNLTRTASMRILLETDAPYMVPGNIYKSLTTLKSGARLPLCHTAMLPWTAAFVAEVANAACAGGGAFTQSLKGADDDTPSDGTSSYDVERVMRVARENARSVYGV